MASPDGLPQSQTHRGRNGLLFSGLLVAVSFVAMIVPLAAYHLAQISATGRRRSAIGVLLAVDGVLLFLGLLSGDLTLQSAALFAFFWTPFLAMALSCRDRSRRIPINLIALSLPAAIVIAIASLVPYLPLATWLEVQRTELVTVWSSHPEGAASLAWWDGLVSTFKNETRLYEQIDRFFRSNFYERLSWLTLGAGTRIFSGVLLTGLVSFIFLEHGFAQIEQLKAISRYVLSRKSVFNEQMVQTLSRLQQHDETPSSKCDVPEVVAHQEGPADGLPFIMQFWMPNQQPNRVVFWGNQFRFSAPPPGDLLRTFRLPIWITFAALVFLGASALGVSGIQFDRLDIVSAAPAAAWASLAAIIVLTILAIQGFLTLFLRLTMLGLLLVCFGIAGVWTALFWSPHAILGCFAIAGLLDYAYDLRGVVAKAPKTV